jgi:DNA-binding CsgD family transcriptional regulator
MKPLSASEYDLTLRAKNGDASANIELWQYYKPVVISMLKVFPGMDKREKLSEGYLVFLHKLDLFNPDKVYDPNKFTLSYMLTGGLKNLRKHLFYKLRYESANISRKPFDDTPEVTADIDYPFLLFTDCGDDFEFKKEEAFERINKEVFNSYNPENTFIRLNENELKEKEQLLYSKLTDVQKEILQLRKDGRTYAEVAKMLGYSITTIKAYYLAAKDLAKEIFYSETSKETKQTQIVNFRKSVLKLRQEGKRYNEIAKILRCSNTKVRNHYQAAKNSK